MCLACRAPIRISVFFVVEKMMMLLLLLLACVKYYPLLRHVDVKGICAKIWLSMYSNVDMVRFKTDNIKGFLKVYIESL